MQALMTGLHGPAAIVLVCALLFVEESGVPLPLLPGDALLITAGILIANGSISPWAFLPAAFVAVLGGVLAAYLWSRKLGLVAVEGVAGRLGARNALERASRRLRAASPLHIMASRLFPGTRIYTTIVAGAAGVDFRIFLLEVIPGIILWLAGFTFLGAIVGVPALASLSHAQHLLVTGAALVVIGLGTYLGIRYIPSAGRPLTTLPWAPRPLLIVFSLVVDLSIAISVVSGVTELVHEGFGFDDPDGIITLALVFAITMLSYTAVARQVIGATAGERLVGIRYAPV